MVTPDAPLARSPGETAAAPPDALFERDFTAEDVTGLRHDFRRQAEAAGLLADALDDFVTAVNELVTNAVRHGGGRGTVRLTFKIDTLIADVSDNGEGFTGRLPVTSGPPAPDRPGGRGILLARLLTDTLMISDSPDGVTVTVTMCVSAPANRRS
jgi:anti-sigma regulatory factor (Ser/Thr protein kinase)